MMHVYICFGSFARFHERVKTMYSWGPISVDKSCVNDLSTLKVMGPGVGRHTGGVTQVVRIRNIK